MVEVYGRASLVLNLTNKDLAVETFGLTALEAMTAGLPVIGPTEGGIAEIVKDGVNGYQIDGRETDRIAKHIREMLSDKALYLRLAKGALETSKKYNENALTNAVADIINDNA